MAVLVTGGAGYIGSHMVHALVDRGEQVVVLDDLSYGNRFAVPDGVPLFVGDTGDRGLVAGILGAHGVTAVAHFAASIRVDESVADPLRYYRNNTANSRTLFETCVAAGVRHLIFSSTAAVYGDVSDRAACETDAPAPLSPYGTSKLMTEWILRDTAAAHGIGYVVLRYFNVAGADPQLRTGEARPVATHLVNVSVQAALGVRPGLSIYGIDYPTSDGTCVRDYIHVADLAQAHVDALDHLRRGGASATLNCGYGRGFSVKEVVETVKAVTGVDFPVTVAPRRPGDPAMIVAEATRIREVLGWRPRLDDLGTIVGHAFAWEQKLRGMNDRRA